MNWEAIGAIAELVGSVAVLVTLVYLALQVRHSREELRRSSQSNRQAWLRDLQMEYVRNPELRAVSLKAHDAIGEDYLPTFNAISEVADLTQEEAMLLNSYLVARWIYRSEMIANIDALDEKQRESFDRMTAREYGSGIGRIWFDAQQNRGVAVGYIEDLIRKQQDASGGIDQETP